MFKKTFTLIEILVVVVIIGILASITVVRLQGWQNKTKVARVKIDLTTMAWVINVAQNTQGKTLMQMTNYNCSYCICWSVPNLTKLPENHICKVWRRSTIDLLFNYAGEKEGVSIRYHRDPRGNPYLLDENEWERPTNRCRTDSLISAGPDGIRGSAFSSQINAWQKGWFESPDTDDIALWLQWLSCK